MATLTSISTSNYYYYIVDTGSIEDGFFLLAMTTKASVEMLKSRLCVSLHEDVRTSCPNTPFKAQVKL